MGQPPKSRKVIEMMGAKFKIEEEIDVGDEVVCDFCNKEWVNDMESKGKGMLMGSYAVCPDCSKRYPIENMDPSEAKRVVKCPPYLNFWQLVMMARGGNNMIRIYTEVKNEATNKKAEDPVK